MLLTVAARLPSLEKTVWVLLSLFIITFPGFTPIGKDIFYVLLLMAIIYMAVARPKISSLNRDEKIIFSILMLFILWTLFTFYINGQPGRGHLFVWSRQVFLLGLIPLYFLFRQYPMPRRWLLITLLISAFVTFSVAIHDVYFGGSTFDGRAMGGMHPILFGSISLFMVAFLLSFLIQTTQSAIFKVLIALAIAGLLVAVILTESRGVWAAIPVMLFFLIYSTAKSLSKQLKFSIVVALIGLLSASYLIPVVEKRVDITVSSVSRYMQSETVNDNGRRSSLGTRFEMWKAGWKIFLDHPVVGVGLGGFQDVARQNMEKYSVNNSASSFYHPHNQYVSELASKGLIGLILYLLLIVSCIKYFSRYLSCEDKNCRLFFFAGTQVFIAFLIFGLSDAVLEGKSTVLFLVVLISIVLAKVSSKKVV